MRKKGGRINESFNIMLMKNEFGVIELTKNELIECDGGMVMLIISFFLPNFKKYVDFVEGVREGYDRALNA